MKVQNIKNNMKKNHTYVHKSVLKERKNAGCSQNIVKDSQKSAQSFINSVLSV